MSKAIEYQSAVFGDSLVVHITDIDQHLFRLLVEAREYANSDHPKLKRIDLCPEMDDALDHTGTELFISGRFSRHPISIDCASNEDAHDALRHLGDKIRHLNEVAALLENRRRTRELEALKKPWANWYPLPSEVDKDDAICEVRLVAIRYGDGRRFESFRVRGTKKQYVNDEFYHAVTDHDGEIQAVLDEQDSSDVAHMHDPMDCTCLYIARVGE